ncbi:uncharacterized protein PHACADRAFT_260012 [Phanerochaete carnosa HHB-10118-sp]|uniref:Terpene synthase n=1 Tax=Phanerochaete carnosa (strain HHB-10118-sp) TaxID=650164 RepID=K5W366_PHACS|nr:uncharacterized protein PHACADRAFT_260012 [Phanerochaete carnosa HHB-10118-sp]EKM53585.1 hypothetical protein PHACADRAFT_260012 [Phanerochaete carnosa HHB-10118-sp]
MALCTCLDDFALEADAMAGFAERFHAGHEQLHPLLGLLVEKLRQMPEFFHSYGAAAVVAGTVQFVICTVMEKKTETMEVHPAAREYPVYKRFRTGVGEASAFCIWDKAHFPEVSTHIQMIPDASKCVCYVNDLLSFYKEELIGEKNNFIHDRARVAGTGAEHALTDTLEDAVNAVNAVQEILQGEDEKKSWESFVTGYVAFHFMTPRYKLKQLFNASD